MGCGGVELEGKTLGKRWSRAIFYIYTARKLEMHSTGRVSAYCVDKGTGFDQTETGDLQVREGPPQIRDLGVAPSERRPKEEKV
jgi:hypothetical protein